MKTNLISSLRIAVVFTLLGLAVMTGCKKDSSPTSVVNTTTGGGSFTSATFTLNGGGYSNQAFTITSNGITALGFDVDAYSVYKASTNVTAIAITNDNTGGNLQQIIIALPGNQTGTFNWTNSTSANNAIAFLLEFTSSSVTTFFYSSLDNGGNINGSVSLTSYGAVGNKINGTFSGKLYKVTAAGIDSSVTVSNGTFSVVRAPDQP